MWLGNGGRLRICVIRRGLYVVPFVRGFVAETAMLTSWCRMVCRSIAVSLLRRTLLSNVCNALRTILHSSTISQAPPFAPPFPTINHRTLTNPTCLSTWLPPSPIPSPNNEQTHRRLRRPPHQPQQNNLRSNLRSPPPRHRPNLHYLRQNELRGISARWPNTRGL